MKRYLLILGLLLACAGPSWAACSSTTIGSSVVCVQVTNCSSSTSAVCTFGSNNTASHTIIVIGLSGGTGSSISVADSRNSYTAKMNITINATDKMYVWEADSIGAGANTVTATITGGNQTDFYAIEFSGLAAGAYDASSSGSQSASSTSLTTGTSGTTAFTNETVLAAYAAGHAPTVSTGYTQLGSYAFGAFDEVDFLSVTSTGTQVGNSTQSPASNYWAVVFTLKAASQPAGTSLGSVLH